MADSSTGSYQPKGRRQAIHDFASNMSSSLKDSTTPTNQKDPATLASLFMLRQHRKPQQQQQQRHNHSYNSNFNSGPDTLGYSEKSSLFNHSEASSSMAREVIGSRNGRQEAEDSFDLILKRDQELMLNPDLEIFNNGKLLRESKLNAIQQAEIASAFIFNQIYHEKRKVRLGYTNKLKALLEKESLGKSNYNLLNYYNPESRLVDNYGNGSDDLVDDEQGLVFSDETATDRPGKPNIHGNGQLAYGNTSRFRNRHSGTSNGSTNNLQVRPATQPPSQQRHLADLIVSVPGYSRDFISQELTRYDEQLNFHRSSQGQGEDDEEAAKVDHYNGTNTEKRARFMKSFGGKKFHSASSYHQHHNQGANSQPSAADMNHQTNQQQTYKFRAPTQDYESQLMVTRATNQKKLQSKFSRSYDFINNLKPIEVEMFLKMDEEFENELLAVKQQNAAEQRTAKIINQNYTNDNFEGSNPGVKALIVDNLSKQVQKMGEEDWMYS